MYTSSTTISTADTEAQIRGLTTVIASSSSQTRYFQLLTYILREENLLGLQSWKEPPGITDSVFLHHVYIFPFEAFSHVIIENYKFFTFININNKYNYIYILLFFHKQL